MEGGAWGRLKSEFVLWFGGLKGVKCSFIVWIRGMGV